ncbi:MAG: type II toxin-antitoxin system RelE/ParE family toxin [Armatimonadetes bacterium]|nr:type II toxin-antitoxin system RelE/ParE family toxin [Armatimonadota bacterium]
MKWEVEYYEKENGEKPVREFQESLPTKHWAKSARDVRLLEEFGTGLREPYVKPVKGEKYRGLWELRTRFGSDISRIFYFLPFGNRIVLLHGYVKKDMKTDTRQLDIANKYRDDYLRRKQDEQS